MSAMYHNPRTGTYRLWVLLAIVFTGACENQPIRSREVINALVIRNQTDHSITDVILRVSSTSRVVRASQILARSEYSLGFPTTENSRNAATLSWTHRNQPYTRNIETSIPEDIDVSVPSRVVITIGDDGQLASRIETNPKRD